MYSYFSVVRKNSFVPSFGTFPIGKLYLPEDVMEWAARLCYNSQFKFGTVPTFMQKIIDSQHFDVLEHGYFGMEDDWQYGSEFRYYFAYQMNKKYPYLKVDILPDNRIGISGNLRTWYEWGKNQFVDIEDSISSESVMKMHLSLANLAPSLFSVPLAHRTQQEQYFGKFFRLQYSGIQDASPLMTGKITESGANVMILSSATHRHSNNVKHFTVQISGLSRACANQLVRHRLLSFSQSSQRYIDASDFPYVIPTEFGKNEIAYVTSLMKELDTAYKHLRKTSIKEDARCVLPNMASTQIVVSGDSTGWNHFFKLRTAKDAQKEIRNIALAIQEMVGEK